MIKLLLITIAGLSLVGCAGLPPAATMLVGAAEPINAVAVQQDASAAQGEPGSKDSTAEQEVTSDMETPADPTLPGVPLFTFAAGEPRWYTVDDSVMGGVSKSVVGIAESGILGFAGAMSLENNGGFASARSEWQTMDLSDSDGILLRVYGDGNSYRLRIRTTTTDRSISYNALFATTPDQWQIVYVPYDEMVPTSFGFVRDVGPLDRANIGSFGFMLSDNQPGEFELYVDWLRAVSEEELRALNN